MYDGGIIWRPTPRTEIAGPRRPSLWRHHRRRLARPPVQRDMPGSTPSVFDTVETFGRSLTNDLSRLPDDFDVNRDPLTGGLGGCVFGAPGRRRLPRPLAAVDHRQQLPRCAAAASSSPASAACGATASAPAMPTAAITGRTMPASTRYRRDRGRELQRLRLGRPRAEPHLGRRISTPSPAGTAATSPASTTSPRSARRSATTAPSCWSGCSCWRRSASTTATTASTAHQRLGPGRPQIHLLSERRPHGEMICTPSITA